MIPDPATVLGGSHGVDPGDVTVVKGDYGLPYSKGLMAQSLMACGLAPERAFHWARQLEARLRERAGGQISIAELWEEAEQVLAGESDEAAVERFRKWRMLGRLDRPLFVLLGGGTGTGKSTIATQLAHRLGVTRVIGTDSIREVLRAFFSHDFMPAVHYSSFDAGDAVRMRQPGDPTTIGFIRQTEHVGVAVNAIASRSLEEETPMVLEGVHLLPGVLRPDIAEGAIVAHAVLAVTDAELHESHFHVRGFATHRSQKRYLDSFERIRKLQRYVVERAREAGVPVIENHSFDQVLTDVMSLVLDTVAKAQETAAADPQERPA
jgi:2-phosphoglycerate kinase